MNKTLIIVLAICLISVHGFVKRDAPVTESFVGDIQKSIKELSDKLTKQVQDVIKPDVIKEKIAEFVNATSNAIEQLQPKPEAPKK